MTNQSFPTFNPIDESFLFFKDRQAVHTEGDWHRGIQANIVRDDGAGSFEILVQLRTNNVDIGLHKLDQSLATQMIREDGLDESETLKRGLKSELAITDYNATKISPKIRIVKTYAEHPKTINRELLTLYIVTLNQPDQLKPDSHKIQTLTWMNWNDMLEAIRTEPSRFSKTAQFYFLCPLFVQFIENASREVLSLNYDSSIKPLEDIVHIDREGTKPVTLFGDIASNLNQVGELE